MKYVSKIPRRAVFLVYLKTTNGLNNLTPNELKILSEFMWYHKRYLEADAYALPGVSLFSTDTRKKVAESVKITHNNLNNLVGTIKKKGFIKEVGRTDLELSDKLDKFVRYYLKTNEAKVTFEFQLFDPQKPQETTTEVPNP